MAFLTRYYLLNEDKTLRRVSSKDWAHWFEADRMHRQMANHVIGGVRVSTVFLGVDHGDGTGPPVVFETMIFGGPYNDYQDRYSTYEDAMKGHWHALALVDPFRAAVLQANAEA
jgi:hypothetical protein